MEMEKINENTIKVSLENDDLTERGITVLDLLGNQKEIESFFYSILDEVDTEHEFRETDAVTFQLIPNLNGLELFITKMDPDSDEEPFSPLKELEKKGKRVQQVDINDLGDADDITDFIRKQLGAALEKSESKMLTANDSETKRLQAKPDYLDDQSNMQKRYLVSFANFEDFIQLVKELDVDGVASNLYKYDDKYYLELIFFVDQVNENEIKDILAIAYEYGEVVSFSAAVIQERARLIMKRNALEIARGYFG